MAEFQEVLRQYHRMCKRHWCGACPCGDKKNLVCMLTETENQRTEEEVENIIMSWAAENPEPVYPTWKNYFASLYGQNYGLYGDKQLSVSRLCDEQIPPEVAQKLGLEPKYG